MNETKHHSQSSLAGKNTTDEEKLRQARNAALQKKYKVISFLLVGIIIAATAMLVFPNDKCKADGHAWASATCTGSKVCTVCGATEGAPLGHSWESATCERPKTCIVCGMTDGGSEHSWIGATKESPATCALCGITTGTRILPTLACTNFCWSEGPDPQYDCQNNEATLSTPGWKNFEESKVTVENAYGEEVSAGSFILRWENGTVHITPDESLPCGVYDITFATQKGNIGYSLCYGYEGEIYLQDLEIGWYDYYGFQNWKSRRYLVQTADGLETTDTYEDCTTFPWHAEMCGIEVGGDGYAYPTNSGKKVEFTTSSYVLQGGGDLYVFTYDGWNMAADPDGLVYFTKELTDECYWETAP